MGWHRIDIPVVEKVDEKAESCGLWTRGGLNGVEIHIDDKIIHLEKSVLLDLFASELISNEISKLEGMEGQEAIDYLLSR